MGIEISSASDITDWRHQSGAEGKALVDRLPVNNVVVQHIKRRMRAIINFPEETVARL
jgi:hypothetical protein